MEILRALSSILPVGSAASQVKGQSSRQAQLTIGQLLKATVVEAVKSQLFSIEINGERFPVQTKIPLSVGQNLQLQVMSNNPQIELKIVADSVNQFIGRSLTLAGQSIDLSSLFQIFNQSVPSPLESLTSSSRSFLESFFTLQQSSLDGQDGGNTVKELLQKIGLQFERNLATGDKNRASNTLKAALLEIAQTFKDSENISSNAIKALTTIELFQLTQLQTASNDFIIFPLPFPFLEAGYLQIEKDSGSQNDTGEDELRFSIHVKVSELGNIGIDFAKLHDTLLIRFRAESIEKMEYIQQFSEELTQAVSSVPNVSVAFTADASDPVNDLVRYLVSEGGNMLDTRA